MLLTSLISIKLFIRLISQAESRRDPGERSHRGEAWRVGFKGRSPWKQTGAAVIGKSGSVHLQVDEEDPQMEGSEVTDHYSFQRADSEISEGSLLPLRPITRVQG